MSIYVPVKIFDMSHSISLEMDRASYLINRVKGHKVLHVGCSDYPNTKDRMESNNLLHAHLTKVISQLLGIDNSIDGVKLLKEKGFNNVMLMDAENIVLNESYDLLSREMYWTI